MTKQDVLESYVRSFSTLDPGFADIDAAAIAELMYAFHFGYDAAILDPFTRSRIFWLMDERSNWFV